MASSSVTLSYLGLILAGEHCPVCLFESIEAHLILVNGSPHIRWMCARKCNLREVS